MNDYSYELLRRLYKKNTLNKVDLSDLVTSQDPIHLIRSSIGHLVSKQYIDANGYLQEFCDIKSKMTVSESFIHLQITELGKAVYLEIHERKKPWYCKSKFIDRILSFISGLFTGFLLPIAFDFIKSHI